jgi:Flp pilus assembly protein TadG
MDTNYPRRKWQAGSSIILLAFGILAIFGFAALSIDISHVYQQQREMQSATDAAALAGAALFPTNDSAAVTAVATAIARTNGLVAAEIGTVEVGQWDTNSLSFKSGTTPYNAVHVPAQRNVGLLFGKPVGSAQCLPRFTLWQCNHSRVRRSILPRSYSQQTLRMFPQALSYLSPSSNSITMGILAKWTYPVTGMMRWLMGAAAVLPTGRPKVASRETQASVGACRAS